MHCRRTSFQKSNVVVIPAAADRGVNSVGIQVSVDATLPESDELSLNETSFRIITHSKYLRKLNACNGVVVFEFYESLGNILMHFTFPVHQIKTSLEQSGCLA